MSVANRLSSLNHKHSQIEEEIKHAYMSHDTDENVCELKKKKLAIKDKIVKLIENLS